MEQESWSHGNIKASKSSNLRKAKYICLAMRRAVKELYSNVKLQQNCPYKQLSLEGPAQLTIVYSDFKDNVGCLENKDPLRPLRPQRPLRHHNLKTKTPHIFFGGGSESRVRNCNQLVANAPEN